LLASDDDPDPFCADAVCEVEFWLFTTDTTWALPGELEELEETNSDAVLEALAD